MFHNMYKYFSLLIVTALTALTALTANAADECGKVTIASMNWQSAEVAAEIDKVILAEGYGCEVELVPGDTQPTLTSMVEKGTPDIAPEGWINSLRVLLDKAVAQGHLHYASKILKDGGVQGFWIPAYTAKKYPELKSIGDVLERPDLFPAPEDKNKGAVYTCPSGWNCQISTNNIFAAWDAEAKDFVLVDPGSGAGLDGSISKAYERGENWLGYYWAPTSILGRYPMVKLDSGVPYDSEQWDKCTSQNDCINPKKNDWPVADVYTVTTDKFKKNNRIAWGYISGRTWGNATVNELLAWMLDNQATGEDGAIHFLENYPQVWRAWVPAKVADKVAASL